MTKKHKDSKKLKILGISILFVTAITVSALAIHYNSEQKHIPTFRNMQTDYDNYSLRVDLSDNCHSETSLNQHIYKIDNQNNIAYVEEIINPDIKESKIRRYYLNYEKNYRKLYFQKYLAADWQYNNLPSNYEYPNSKIKKVLNYIKEASSDAISENKEEAIYGISFFKNEEDVYQNVNSLAVLGNDWTSNHFNENQARYWYYRGLQAPNSGQGLSLLRS